MLRSINRQLLRSWKQTNAVADVLPHVISSLPPPARTHTKASLAKLHALRHLGHRTRPRRDLYSTSMSAGNVLAPRQILAVRRSILHMQTYDSVVIFFQHRQW